MSDFLSAIVPVHNAEAQLGPCISRLLEILPDQAARFDIVIVDDASTDHTVDVAQQLAAQYPQLRLLRNRRRLGTSAAIRKGLEQARGRAVIVQEDLKSFGAAIPAISDPGRFRIDQSQIQPGAPRPTTFIEHLRRLTVGV